jgi:HK97 family phage prohead protease
MRWWPRRRVSRETRTVSRETRELFTWAPGAVQPWLPGGTYVGTILSGRVTRAEALSVPAVLRGRNLICSVAALPLVMRDPARNTVPARLLNQIDSNTANVVTLAQTLEDLIFDAVAWWRVTSYDWAGFPASAQHVDVAAVALQPPPGYPINPLPSGLYPQGVVYVAGVPVDARDMIRFDSPNPPLAVVGARAIRRSLKMAQAAEMYADDPEARAYWTPNDGADPADDIEIAGMLRRYAEARRRGAEAYIPAAVTRQQAQVMSPADLTLSQLQQRADLEIANLMGLDPEDLGVNTTSRTYANAVDRRIDQVNQNLGVWMQAVTGRLSMDDVTRRGYRTVFSLDRYMQADPATRWGTYEIANRIGAKSVSEIQAEEDLPESAGSPPTPAAAAAPAVPAGQPVANTGVSRETAPPLRAVSFDADPAGEQIAFPADSLGEGFAVASGRRVVSGTLIPYGPVGTNRNGSWRFAPGSVSWQRAAVSRVKLDREHDPAQLLGAATEIRASDKGVTAAFKIARTAGGDEALQLAEDGALDGFSAVVAIEDYTADPTDEGVFLVTAATLRRATLTADPAFSDARLTHVAATTAGGGPVFNQTGAPPTPAAPPAPAAPSPAPPAPAAPSPAPAPTAGEQFAAAATAFAAAVEALNGMIPPEQRPAVRPVAQVREPLVYQLNGLGHSFVRDAWTARSNDPASYTAREEAMARLRKYSEQTAALNALEVQRFANAGNTTDQAVLLPTGYRPDLYVGQIPQGRPLADAIGTRVILANATPFTIPVWVGSANLSGTNSEGTGPDTGTITDHTYRTFTPTAQSGEFMLTREVMDAANPALDVIARNAMQEEYRQDTEAIIAAAIAAATDNDTGSGQSTEGCYVYAVTGTGNDLYLDGIRAVEAEYPTHRFMTPDRMLASPTGYKGLVGAIDDIGRPMFPYSNPSNAGGSTGRAAGSLMVDGMDVPNAWSMTSTHDDVIMFNGVDMLLGESPLLTFTFFEKGGPENIYLNTWGYFGFQILRYPGIHAINYTAA